MPRSLLHEVSIQELERMRSEGMSNREIADRLNCGYSTVCHYLGRQPDSVRAEYGSHKTRAKDVDKPTEAKPPLLRCVSRILEYEGAEMRYCVTPDAGFVTVTRSGNAEPVMRANKGQLEIFITELIDILGMLTPEKKG